MKGGTRAPVNMETAVLSLYIGTHDASTKLVMIGRESSAGVSAWDWKKTNRYDFKIGNSREQASENARRTVRKCIAVENGGKMVEGGA